MRPTDENQHGSTRPNLLSGGRRRFSGDDNILERLERDSARHASGNRSRAAWYAASASLVLLVIVIVAWMAFENANTVQVVPMAQAPATTHAAVATADPPTFAGAQPAPPSAPPAGQEVSPPVPSPVAAPVAAPPVHVRDGAIAALPPLVLLQGHEAAVQPAGPASKRAVPVPGVAATSVKAPVRTSPPAPRATPPRPVPRAAVVVRVRKPAAGPAAEAPVDTDVALLSAIIIHDSAHAAEKAQLEAAAVCARTVERKCASKVTAGRD